MKTNSITLYCVETHSGKVLTRSNTRNSARVYLNTYRELVGKELADGPRIVARKFVADAKPARTAKRP